MNIVITGHVDHGKSTIIGRLLAETGALPDGKLERVQETCRRNSKPFEYAFLLDALRDEQDQGITIDCARVFFKTQKREYTVLDAPGHIEFVKNMITGASRAEAAFLVIDAQEGVQENSRRHAHLLSMLGVRQVAVLINKIDLVDFDQKRFEEVSSEMREYLAQHQVEPKVFVPVSGREGDGLCQASDRMPWYDGPTVLQVLDGFEPEAPLVEQKFRMPVQGVYKFTQNGDDRRIVAGTVTSGSCRVGDEIIFWPSGKKSRIETIEAFSEPQLERLSAGQAKGFTLSEQLYLQRGEMAVRAEDPAPQVTTRFKASLFWLGQQPLELDRKVTLKLGTLRTSARLVEIESVSQSRDLETSGSGSIKIQKNEIASVLIETDRPVVFDLASEMNATSRFVLVDDYEISGGGIIVEGLADAQLELRNRMMKRSYKWVPDLMSASERGLRFGQIPCLVILSGGESEQRIAFAREIERELIERGKNAYFMGMANLLYGIDSDLTGRGEEEELRPEHIRRLAEVSHLLLDTGLITIVTARGIDDRDLEVIRTIMPSGRIRPLWISEDPSEPSPMDQAQILRPDRDSAQGFVASLAEDKTLFPISRTIRDQQNDAQILWFTGLSGAGKTTIARQVVENLKGLGKPVELLDGDEIRSEFPSTGFDRESRNQHLMRVGSMASRLQKHGVWVVASLVSPYRESREWIRERCTNFNEIYVSTPLEVCEERDVKGFYKRARAGEIAEFTGVSDSYEAPQNAELVVDSSRVSVDEAVDIVLRLVVESR